LRLRNGIRVGILGLIVAAAITPGVAMAADFRVTTTADGDDKECVLDCTLREAVILAGSGDQVLVPSGTYVLTGGELSLNTDTIVGEDARKTIIDGDNKSRVLRVIEAVSRVSNVTIRNGNGVGLTSGAGGGIFVDSGTLLLQNSTVSGNTATTGGGIAAAGIVQLIGVTVSGNRATGLRLTRGGGITTSSTGGLFLGNTTVSGNTAADESGSSSQGGGIYSSGNLLIAASTIANNSASAGGGLYVVTPPTGAAGTVQNSILAHGTGGACGGDDFNATASIASDATCQLKDPSNPTTSTRSSGSWPTTAGRPTPTRCSRRALPSGRRRAARRSTSAASPGSRPATRAPTSTARRR
jgi:CSLREA domain-containing protein